MLKNLLFDNVYDVLGSVWILTINSLRSRLF